MSEMLLVMSESALHRHLRRIMFNDLTLSCT
jgi:hypothetical protein